MFIVQIVFGVLSFFVLVGCDRSSVEQESLPPRQTASLQDARGDYKVGMSESAFLELAGAPDGIITMGEKKLFSYSGVTVTIMNEIVQLIPADFEARAESARGAIEQREKEKSANPARVKLHDRRNMAADKRPPKPVRDVPASPPPEVGHVIYTSNGEEVNHSYFTSNLRSTVIVFHAEDSYGYYSSASQKLIGQLRGFLKKHPRVALRLVNVGYRGSDDAKRYVVSQIPEVRVFNSKQKMVGRPTCSFQNIAEYIQFAEKPF